MKPIKNHWKQMVKLLLCATLLIVAASVGKSFFPKTANQRLNYKATSTGINVATRSLGLDITVTLREGETNRGVVVVTYNFVGQDDKNIIMIELNPILSRLSHSDYRPLINSILYLWHLLSISSMILYGAFLMLLFAFIIREKGEFRNDKKDYFTLQAKNVSEEQNEEQWRKDLVCKEHLKKVLCGIEKQLISCLPHSLFYLEFF